MIVSVLQGAQGDESPRQAQLRRPLEFPDGVLHVVDIQHGNALEPLRVGLTEVRQPVIIGAEDRREQGAIGNAIRGQGLRRVEHTAGHRIPIHILHVGLRVVPAPGHRRHAALQGQGFRGLKPYPGLLIDPDGPECDTVRIPLIGLRLVDEAGGAR
jgi:hypothetical protein